MTEARVLWAMVADQFVVDQTGKFSLVGVWENLRAFAFPAVHPLMFIVSAWEGIPNVSLPAETRLWSPQQALLQTIGPQVVATGPRGRALNVTQLIQVQFPTPGSYRIELLAAGSSLFHFDIQLELLIPAAVTSA